MNITVRKRFVVNGKEYRDMSEMPEPLRRAVEKATGDGGGLGSHAAVAGTLVVNGRAIGSLDEVPQPLRAFVEGALGVAAATSGTPVLSATETAPCEDAGSAESPIGAAPIEPHASAPRLKWLLLVVALGLLVIWLLRTTRV